MTDRLTQLKKKTKQKRQRDPTMMHKLRKKLKKLKKDDPNIYPMN